MYSSTSICAWFKSSSTYYCGKGGRHTPLRALVPFSLPQEKTRNWEPSPGLTSIRSPKILETEQPPLSFSPQLFFFYPSFLFPLTHDFALMTPSRSSHSDKEEWEWALCGPDPNMSFLWRYDRTEKNPITRAPEILEEKIITDPRSPLPSSFDLRNKTGKEVE